MRKYSFRLFVVLLCIKFLVADQFTIQNNSADIIINGSVLDQPFTGGTNYARISWHDWDSDGDVDLFLLDEDFHFRYFENIGTPYQSDFILSDNPILNLSGMSWFYLADFDVDGMIDLACQSLDDPDQVMYYEYNGIEFYLVSIIYQINGYPVHSTASMKPTFCDIDNDGDLDFFTGDISGTISFYENHGFSNDAPVYELISSFWEEILIIGPSRHGASAISFIDLDSDGDFDLAWGDYFQRSLYIIWNVGTPEDPDMDNVGFSFQYPENDPIYTSGQNMPSFADIDGDEDMDLFVTVLGGDGPVQLSDNFLMYENTGSSLNPEYNLTTENFLGTLDLLSDIIPEFIDIDDDGDMDMFIGQDYTTETNPTMGRIYYFMNEGLDHPTWSLQDSAFLGTEIGLSLAPEFIDIDGDEDYDVFVGDYNGKITYFKNEGTPTNHNFVSMGYLQNIDLGFFSTPKFCDIDADGDHDLFVGNYEGGLYFYLNGGDSNDFNFIETTIEIQGIEELARTSPEFHDLDLDGDFDLVLGTGSSGIRIYWNTGTENSFNFVPDTCTAVPYMGMHLKPSIESITSQNTMDFYAGLSTGGALHYIIAPFGDVNSDMNLDILDIIDVINYILFDLDSETICSGDLNHDQSIGIGDLVLIVNNILQ